MYRIPFASYTLPEDKVPYSMCLRILFEDFFRCMHKNAIILRTKVFCMLLFEFIVFENFLRKYHIPAFSPFVELLEHKSSK